MPLVQHIYNNQIQSSVPDAWHRTDACQWRSVATIAIRRSHNFSDMYEDVYSAEVSHLEHTHRHAKVLQHAVNTVWVNAKINEQRGGLAIREEYAIRSETHAISNHNRDLISIFAELD